MSFLNNLVNEFTHRPQGQSGEVYQQQQTSYSQQGGYPPRPQGYSDQPYNNNNRPNPPEPWVTEWDTERSTWIFINRQTGQRQHEFPRGGGGGGGGYQQTTYEQVRYDQPPPPQQQRPDHSTRNTALGVAAGLAGGAFLMHEGHKVEEKWDEDRERFDYDRDRMEERADYDRDRIEDRVDYDRDRFEDRVEYDRDRVDDRVEYDTYRVEDRVYDGVDDVRDFPEDAARWTGRKVEEVEDIPEDVAGWAGRKVEEVEDIPEDVAGWAGRRVEGVERFGDEIRDSYDDGRAEQAYRDDERYDDRW